MNEIWKSLDFIGFPNYQVSNCGRVKGPKGIRALQNNGRNYLSILNGFIWSYNKLM